MRDHIGQDSTKIYRTDAYAQFLSVGFFVA